jgi:hypothetical protein
LDFENLEIVMEDNIENVSQLIFAPILELFFALFLPLAGLIVVAYALSQVTFKFLFKEPK